jgi:hypothetical protein
MRSSPLETAAIVLIVALKFALPAHPPLPFAAGCQLVDGVDGDLLIRLACRTR